MKTVLFVFLVVTIFICCGKNSVSVEDLDLPDDVVFTYLPTDLSKMAEFGAIGQITGIPKAHGGFTLKTYYSTTPDIPVHAMSDGVIYNIRYESQIFEGFAPEELQGQEYDDFALEIALTETAKMHYGHLSKLSPEILQEAGTITKGRGVENRVIIHYKAGQIIAYIGTHPGFDIGLNDLKKAPYFANPDRYPPEYRSAIPFTDYLTPELREQVWEINPRTVEPRGGKVAYDVEGTISGNWFLEGTTSLTEWSKQLIIARQERYADRITISDASPLFDGDGAQNSGVDTYLWWIFGNEPLPETITLSSGKVKYKVATWYLLYSNENTPAEGTVMIEMTARDKIMYEFFAGKLPEEVDDFTTAVKMYER